ncbi:MAG: Protein GrpE [Verrucomicrobiae bacterium]|nr:Protein GrpE [Verrucomicrobiae bacterium]
MTTENQPDQTAPPPAAAEPTAPTLEQQLTEAQAAAAANWDKFLRATADFDNYRKRVTRERDELIRNARENLITALLPALDNLERALEHSPEGTPLHDGLLQVQKQFARSLAEFGLAEITVNPGTTFDPNLHEAVSQVESTDHPDGSVVEQLQSAYKLGDRLLRPARVVVSKGSPAAAGSPTPA